MKRYYNFLSLLVFFVFFFTGCLNNQENTSETKYRIGDIILNDGTILKDIDHLTDTQKSKVIAIIYKVNNGKVWGMGIAKSPSNVCFCTDNANAYYEFLDTIEIHYGKVKSNENDGIDWEFSTLVGDKDGSDNLLQISNTLGNNDDTNDSDKYPAFYYCLNYKKLNESHLQGSEYEEGWYLPTAYECLDIYLVKDQLNPVLEMCSGWKFDSENNKFWTSSQTEAFENEDGEGVTTYRAYTFSFYYGMPDDDPKNDARHSAFPIRQF